ncbi:LytTR family DNA-binding domain-containing protein [Pedobacter nototheniae]|uniref:LytR/AlgR family response regulator transcription factor n=1 Tax=Pedobacter nototheniae TaxID=2488994 RepID=UPI002931ABB6|nr:LytTR family DNA-binding domain-containing protein [Pedobacter nototheniae]
MSKPLKCVIIDDEDFAVKLLSEYIEMIQELVIIKTFTNPLTALAEITYADEIDILFLDIDMPGLSGIDLATVLTNKIKHLIFTTGHDQYALQAFAVNAEGYLLKPINPLRFIETVKRILNKEEKKIDVVKKKKDNLFFIKGDVKGRFIGISPDEIILFYTNAHYITIETTSNQYQTNDTMKNIEERLKDDIRFIRVHQSNIINTEKIIQVDGNTVFLTNNWKVPVSEHYKKSFMNFISQKLLNPK